jgi:mannan polymerase II complex ANP1 subunit
MQEMEEERVKRETEEQEWVERLKKIKDQFIDTSSQWERDKADIQGLAMKEKEKTASTPSPIVNEGQPQVPVGAAIVKSDPERVGQEQKE